MAGLYGFDIAETHSLLAGNGAATEATGGPQNESFRIIDFLGRGAFGEVYRATGVSTGALFAVKLLPLGDMGDVPGRIALLNETKAARQIAHPNVVRVLYVDEGRNDDIGPYVCMEYVSGGTLASLLRGQNQAGAKIPIARAVEMMIDIAQGARAINEKVVHRDIKPDNVLIEGKTLKIGDFGISRFLGESTRPETFKGGQHIAYMAPEGWASEENAYKLDVCAVGLVFFQILALKYPLISKVPDPNNFLDWERVHLFEACPDIRSSRPETPLSLAQLLLRMAAKRPQQRPDWTEVLRVLTDPATEPVDARRAASPLFSRAR
jgi:eukaryotic-like serine/threonine-protein kinase